MRATLILLFITVWAAVALVHVQAQQQLEDVPVAQEIDFGHAALLDVSARADLDADMEESATLDMTLQADLDEQMENESDMQDAEWAGGLESEVDMIDAEMPLFAETEAEAERCEEGDCAWQPQERGVRRRITRWFRRKTHIGPERNWSGGAFKPLVHYRPAGRAARGMDYWSELYQHETGGELMPPPTRQVKVAILGKNTPPVKMTEDDAKTYFANIDQLLAAEALEGEDGLKKKALELGYPAGSLSGEYYNRVNHKLSSGLLLNKAGRLDPALYPIPPPSTFQKPLEGYKIGLDEGSLENYPNGASAGLERPPAWKGYYGLKRD